MLMGTLPVTPLLYQGLFADTVGTGFVFMQARWYQPSTGQFMSRDPMVDQTLEPYAYADHSPVLDGDPTGLSARGVRQHAAQVVWHAKRAR